MGRLTLNVLLSFAQFEREVIGERVRDKIAASKRKGIWVGGPVPLGYRSVDKKLEVVPEAAERVRQIFTTYLEVGSIGSLVAALDREGVRPSPKTPADAGNRETGRFGFGPLAYMLKNRMYVGEVAYRGEIFRGEHEPILDRGLFEAVQARLADQTVERTTKRLKSSSLLLGRLFDDRGNAMSPSHTKKNGVRYRYYVSQALLQGRKEDAGSVVRVSAPDVEHVFLEAIRARVPVHSTEAISDRELVERHIERATIGGDRISIVWSDDHEDASSQTTELPFTASSSPQKGVAYSPSDTGTISAENRTRLLTAIARSRDWMESMVRGSTLEDIARAEKLPDRSIRFLAPLACLSPRIVEAIAEGRAPRDLTVTGLTRNLPLSWREQEQMVGLA